ncbi:MAG: hypothetical protein ACK515_22425 [bacterium]|jgi:hypothetical protein|nr:hypothetical protein [Betaproteobacteria bacterium]
MNRLHCAARRPGDEAAAAAAGRLRPVRAIALLLAATLCPGPGLAFAQDGIGRLFFTPAQRQQLDEARRRPPAPEPVRDGSEVQKPPQAQSLSVDGIVRRADGQATVWVNRSPTQAPQTTGALRIGPVRDAADGADLRLPDSGRRVRIKVGQEVDVQSGRIQERYRQPPPVAEASPAPPAAAPPAAPGPATAKGPADDAQGAGAAAAPRTEAARDAAVDRILRELGRRLDEPARPAEPAR